MKHGARFFFLSGFILALLFLWRKPAADAETYAWGFHGHKLINRMAVFTLPPSMIGFYKKHITFISDHAVDPDKRRYAVNDEAARHYLDADHYGPSPFDSLPELWPVAVKKYGEDSLKAHGIVPWWINTMVYRLTSAFRKENVEEILHYSADIGHYIADAHVPLHTTSNYNGQKTDQKGIHAFWESRLPELYSESYEFLAGRAVYIEKPLKASWNAVRNSYLAVDSVLGFEKKLTADFPPDKKYSFEDRGGSMVKVYSVEFSKAYHDMLKGMVERRMLDAVAMVGSIWYTAWVNAGQPDLDRLGTRIYSDSVKKAQEEMEELWKKGGGQPHPGHED
ncbi:MAG: S1/P1 Nuclease [Bacteroidia bacterium]|nr:S1/P1 Nuclease [Bacteroidia bacterium]